MRLALGPREIVGAGILVAFMGWAGIAAAMNGFLLPLTSPYAVGSLALAGGVVLGETIPGRLRPRTLCWAALGLATFLLVGVALSNGPAKLPTGYANANAALATQLMAVAGLLLVRIRGESRRAVWLTLLLALVVVVANRSNAGTVVALPVLMAVLWSRRGSRLRWPYPLMGAAASIAAAWGVIQLARRSNWHGGVERTLDAARRSLWQDALSAWSWHPVTGIGPGRFEEVSRLGFDTDTAAAHSAVLQIGAETGWVGVGLFALVVGAAFWWVSRSSGQNAVLGSAAVAALVIHSQVDHLLDFGSVVLLAGIVIGWAGATSASEELDVAEGQGPVP